jgi:hypothetical protein
MTFTEARQTMTDDACDILAALDQASGMTLDVITSTTGAGVHVTRFILEQMAVFGLVVSHNGLWELSGAFKTSYRG